MSPISIGARITRRLAGGLAILWLASSALVYFSVRTALYAKFEAELKSAAQKVRSNSDSDQDAPARTETTMGSVLEHFVEAYFEIWTHDGVSLWKSANLGEAELRPPDFDDTEDRNWNARLPGGEPIRCAEMIFSGRAAWMFRRNRQPAPGANGADKPQKLIIVIGRSRDRLNRTLLTLLLGLGLTGVLGAIAAVLMIRGAVRTGLASLRQVAELAAALETRALNTRFDTTELPVELQPICLRMNSLLERIQASFERERRFSSDLSHEMRTPVAELKMLAETAVSFPDQVEDRFFEDTLEIAHQLQASVEALEMLAQIENHSNHLVFEDIEVGGLINECWKPWEAKAKLRGLTLRREIPNAAKWNSSRPLLRIILGNLFSNAVAYTPEGGAVIVRAGDDGITLSVGNDANGLSEADLEKLFEPFWRRGQSRTDSRHSGLGLALVKACAETLALGITARLDDHGMLWMELSNDPVEDSAKP